ncbi:hypothetical protein Tco_0531949 [Tanacetum coccineum]
MIRPIHHEPGKKFNSQERTIVAFHCHEFNQSEDLNKSQYQELFDVGLLEDFHLHCEYFRITRMFWQYHEDNA